MLADALSFPSVSFGLAASQHLYGCETVLSFSDSGLVNSVNSSTFSNRRTSAGRHPVTIQEPKLLY
jgi:sulfopyruvate decarboxylase TPP-binding subunit